MTNWNIPKSFTQGDRITWITELPDYDPTTVSCFIRGAVNPVDLTAIPQANLNGSVISWQFTITEAQSIAFTPGKYKVQLVLFTPERKTLGTTTIEVCPSFESLTELDTRHEDEIELEAVTKAIAQLSTKNVAEYYIGTRRVRYNDLGSLYERQKYLRNRIAKRKNKSSIGGRNVGISFCD